MSYGSVMARDPASGEIRTYAVSTADLDAELDARQRPRTRAASTLR